MTARVRRLAVLAGAVLLGGVPLFTANQAHQNLVILSMVLAVSAVAVNIMGGYGGYFSFGEAVPFGVGAYTAAILARHTGLSPFVWLPAAALASAVYALFVGAVAARGRGHTFVILTMTALLLVQFVATQATPLTNGPAGLPLPTPGWSPAYLNWPFHFALFALLVAALLLSARVRRTKLGLGLFAIRDDEDKAATIGVNTRVYKVVGFAMGAAVLGLAGGVYAYYAAFIDPVYVFSVLLSGQMLLAMLLGGTGTLFGPVIGAFVLQFLDYYGNLTLGGGNVRLLIVGGLLVAVTLFFPRGLLPTVEGFARGRGGGPVPGGGGEPARPGRVTGVRERVAPPPDRPMLQVRGLRRGFGGVRAVDGCSFAVAAGSITALIGPNGSGKTTTFNLVGGTMRADGGEVWLDGERVDRLPAWSRAHRGLARTFQTTRLFGRMSVLENVVTPLRAFSWRGLGAVAVSGPEARRAGELLDLVGMGALRDQPAAALSYGQRKLVELAQVLILEPKLILLDEPAGGINPRLIERMGELIVELNRAGHTFLVVEHNMPFVLGLSDRVLVLSRGRCIAEGSPEKIQRDPLVLDAYLGADFVARPASVGKQPTGERLRSPAGE
ncbi:branched-chain amino acid ABC transporter ATP-binding protein/permease [Pseudonocardia acaciae]|uniref:branched-chain amino acid ABC transporter ATP-binding protein/permease n=1 Tax=Pseudonocardia acaciae TaxID=551276 RepID=UPI0007E8BB5C|nr:branched-chain amino acid ABC transporter ATP-binding protein/permease [Pseudonocardia acaciae]